ERKTLTNDESIGEDKKPIDSHNKGNDDGGLRSGERCLCPSYEEQGNHDGRRHPGDHPADFRTESFCEECCSCEPEASNEEGHEELEQKKALHGQEWEEHECRREPQ